MQRVDLAAHILAQPATARSSDLGMSNFIEDIVMSHRAETAANQSKQPESKRTGEPAEKPVVGGARGKRPEGVPKDIADRIVNDQRAAEHTRPRHARVVGRWVEGGTTMLMLGLGINHGVRVV
jgi:hypothetical protein